MNLVRLDEIVYEAIANGAQNENEVETYIRFYHPRINYDAVAAKIDEIIDDYIDGFGDETESAAETTETVEHGELENV